MTRLVAIAALLLVGVQVGRAEEPQSLLDGWKFQLTPYIWLPKIDGTATVRGVRSEVDLSIADSLDLIGDGLSLLAGFGQFEARRDRVFGLLHVAVLRLDTDDAIKIEPSVGTISGRGRIETDTRADAGFVMGALGYRLAELVFPGRPRQGWLDAYAGARYHYMWTKLEVKGSVVANLGPQLGRVRKGFRGRDTGTIDWVDPFIGFRTSLPILDAMDFQMRGDIGGFEAGAELTWGLIGNFAYHPSWRLGEAAPVVVLGYRVFDIDYEGRSTNRFKLNMRGPFTGIGFVF